MPLPDGPNILRLCNMYSFVYNTATITDRQTNGQTAR